MLRSGRFAAAAASSLLVGAFFVGTWNDARAATTAAGCQDAEVAVLAAPIAPWKGAPLRVLVATEQTLDGEFSLIAPDGSVAAKSHERLGGPPYFWIAEVASDPRQRLADSQHVGPRDRKLVFGVDREIVRCAARHRTVVEGLARSPARSIAESFVRLFRSRRRQRHDKPSPRLRRLCLFLACIFCIQNGTAVRLFELLAQRQVLPVVQHRASRSDPSAAATRTKNCLRGLGRDCSSTRAEASGNRAVIRPIFADRRRRCPLGLGARVRERRQHRFLYDPADTAGVAPGDSLCRSLRARDDAGAARAAI